MLLNNTPLHGYATFYVSVHTPVFGRLGCVHFVAITINAAVNTREQVFVRMRFNFSEEGTQEWTPWVVWNSCLTF